MPGAKHETHPASFPTIEIANANTEPTLLARPERVAFHGQPSSHGKQSHHIGYPERREPRRERLAKCIESLVLQANRV